MFPQRDRRAAKELGEERCSSTASKVAAEYEVKRSAIIPGDPLWSVGRHHYNARLSKCFIELTALIKDGHITQVFDPSDNVILLTCEAAPYHWVCFDEGKRVDYDDGKKRIESLLRE
jgi:hypothetical protein